MKKRVFLLYIVTAILFSCSSDDDYETLLDDGQIIDNQNDNLGVDSSILTLPESPFNYANILLPDFFLDNDVQDEDNTPNNNAITDNGATLGRVLFYDTKLSLNNTISCASCHIQENGFSDPDQFSTGFDGGLTPRNSMGLANAR